VEDTLNNSNDLFLTFRREMEEMSKKTKRLEKENLTLSRKHEATNQNILKMAEERTRTHKELDLLRKKNENLEKLCRGMQAQGRGQIPPLPPLEHHLDDEEGTESEYDEDEEEYEDEESEDEFDDDDTEDEHLHEVHTATTGARRPFGPVPPPTTPVLANGSATVNGRKESQHLTGQQLNGIRA
jgi:chromosome segregation ATPase